MFDSHLLEQIIADLWGAVWQILLFFAVVGSAYAVVLSAHGNRELSSQMERELERQDHLDVEWRHLILEQSALTEHNRIEALVADNLNMRRPKPDEEIVVKIE